MSKGPNHIRAQLAKMYAGVPMVQSMPRFDLQRSVAGHDYVVVFPQSGPDVWLLDGDDNLTRKLDAVEAEGMLESLDESFPNWRESFGGDPNE